jgi:alpha-beta hydrolase superfamily lysophospholipase
MQIMKEIEQRSQVTMLSGGDKLFGILHRPSVHMAPAVVIIHGFASHKIGTNRSWVVLSEALREAGIAVLRFDQRGFGDSEGDFSKLAISDMLEDVQVALNYVQGLEGIDKKRIGLFGSSFGGALAVVAASQVQSVRALALWAPVASGPLWIADWFKANPTLAMSPDPGKALSTFRGITLSRLFQEQFKHFSAVEALSKLSDVPLLHMHGEEDNMIPLQHQKAYQLARKEARAESTFITYPNTNHFLGREAIAQEAMRTYVNWFTKQLQP